MKESGKLGERENEDFPTNYRPQPGGTRSPVENGAGFRGLNGYIIGAVPGHR